MRPSTAVDNRTYVPTLRERLSRALTVMHLRGAELSDRDGSAADLLHRIRRMRQALDRVVDFAVLHARKQGLSMHQVAAELGVPVHAVEARLRALRTDAAAA